MILRQLDRRMGLAGGWDRIFTKTCWAIWLQDGALIDDPSSVLEENLFSSEQKIGKEQKWNIFLVGYWSNWETRRFMGQEF